MATTRSSRARRFEPDALAGLARRVPEPMIRFGMASPGGSLVVDQIMRLMPSQLRTPPTGDAVVRWQIETGRRGSRTWYLVFAGGSCRATRREPGERPRITFTLTGERLLRLAVGQENPMAMFHAGHIKISGDLFFAAQLSSMFKIPTA